MHGPVCRPALSVSGSEASAKIRWALTIARKAFSGSRKTAITASPIVFTNAPSSSAIAFFKTSKWFITRANAVASPISRYNRDLFAGSQCFARKQIAEDLQRRHFRRGRRLIAPDRLLEQE